MKQYQIIFTPVDSYFFGGEKHRKKQGNLVADYFVETNPYPQQTTILGLLRYLLLTLNPQVFDGKKIINEGEAKKLIGERSFSYPVPPASYGKIKSISPLYFLYRKGNKGMPYFFAPKDLKFQLKDDFLLEYDGERFNAKAHYNKIDMYLTNGKEVKSISEIVNYHTKIGIEKRQKGDPPQEKFYKMTTARLKENWSFAVDVELEDGSNISNSKPYFLPFGGERSMFKVEVIPENHQYFPVLPSFYRRNIPFIVCNSDCFIKSEELKKAKFGVTDYVSFRNIHTNVDKTKKYSALSHKTKEQLVLSQRYNLLQRGSVLYFDTEDELNDFIQSNNDTALQNVGFNHFHYNLKN